MGFEELIEAAVERAVERVLERRMKPTAENPAELIPVDEAARLAHVSPPTIRRWVDDGLLGRYGSARRLRVRRDELLQVKPRPVQKRTADDVVASLLKKRSS